MKAFHHFILLALLMLLILLPVAFVFLTIEKRPVVTEMKLVNTADAVRAKNLIKKSVKNLLAQGNTDWPEKYDSTRKTVAPP